MRRALLRVPLRTTLAASAVAITLSAVPLIAVQTAAPPAGEVVTAFVKRVGAYAELRKRLEKGDARLRETEDAGKILAAQQALARQIRTTRSRAKVGDIFTADVRPVFRRLLGAQLRGADGAENAAAIRADNPGTLALRVNEPYPKNQALSTVPPDVLKTLPTLPDDIEYRFVGKHLILYDSLAGLVVDVLPNALP